MKITKYKVKSEDLQDAIIAGIVFLVIVIFFVEKHRREGGCVSCQQNTSQSKYGQDWIDFLTGMGDYSNVTQEPVIPTQFTAEQLRRGY